MSDPNHAFNKQLNEVSKASKPLMTPTLENTNADELHSEKMSERHSQEPWTLDDLGRILRPDKQEVTADRFLSRPDKVRIVACVNFLASVPDAVLVRPAHSSSSKQPSFTETCAGFNREIDKLRAENERLREEKAQAVNERDEMLLKMADAEKERNEWFAKCLDAENERDAAKAEVEKWKLRCVALQADATQTP